MAQAKATGFRELEATLREMPKATARNSLQRGLKKVAQPVADDWQAKAPRDKGNLAQSIIIGPSSRLTGRQRKDSKREGTYFAEIHVGTADPAGQQQEFGNINHPAQPSGRPAWDANKDAALENFGKEVWADLQKVAARRARKLAKG